MALAIVGDEGVCVRAEREREKRQLPHVKAGPDTADGGY